MIVCKTEGRRSAPGGFAAAGHCRRSTSEKGSRTLRCFWHPTRRISLPASRCRSMAARLSTSIETRERRTPSKSAARFGCYQRSCRWTARRPPFASGPAEHAIYGARARLASIRHVAKRPGSPMETREKRPAASHSAAGTSKLSKRSKLRLGAVRN